MTLWPNATFAQSSDDEEAPHRTRVALGPQLVPSYPGSKDVSLRPLVDVARTRGDDPYAFEAPDESFGFPVVEKGNLSIGPAIGFEGSRTVDEVGVNLAEVGFTFELGAFAQFQLSENLRLRGELRKGLGGHKGWIGAIGGDYIMRRADGWLFSIGPRMTLSNGRYHRAYFGVSPEDAASSGLTTFEPDGGLQAVGATVGFIREFSPRWGLYSYAKFDRLVGDAAGSPIVRSFGSRDQWSGGVALTYSFGRVVD